MWSSIAHLNHFSELTCYIKCYILSRARGAGSPSIRQTSKPRRDTVREPFSPHKGGLNYRNKNGISTGAILTKAG